MGGLLPFRCPACGLEGCITEAQRDHLEAVTCPRCRASRPKGVKWSPGYLDPSVHNRPTVERDAALALARRRRGHGVL